jgi:excinuclease ABC subunit C
MTAVINRLSQKLGLEKAANYIESYDISNYSDQTIAAGMVVFENGYPLKKAYRHFNIDISSQNDFLSMYITLSRRLSHINKDEKDEYFNRMPDLLLIDGGVEQLRYVKKALDESNLDIPFFGMVKNSRHRTRAVVDVEGREYNISNDREIFDFLTALQDEVHRYSITYMRKKHKSQAYTSALASVKGIGKVKYSLLMTKYKTLKALKKAGRAELKELLSVSDDTIDELMTVIEEL